MRRLWPPVIMICMFIGLYRSCTAWNDKRLQSDAKWKYLNESEETKAQFKRLADYDEDKFQEALAAGRRHWLAETQAATQKGNP
ncbi:MAG: hypothetical protein WCI73_14150 [Phycisphaerae bacterium]